MFSEKEKLEEELKLLKESFSLDVITEEEYEGAKRRIEGKVSELGEKESSEKGHDIKEAKALQKEEIKFQKEDASVDADKLRAGIGEQEEKQQLNEDEWKEKESTAEDILKSAEETAEEDVAKALNHEGKKEKLARVPQPEQPSIFEEEKGSKKVYAYAGIALVIVIGLYFFFFAEDVNIYDDSQNIEVKNLIACSSDDDCKQEGMIGTCIDPGKENSKCEYIQDAKVGLTVLNGQQCFNCRTERVISMLEGFFPNIEMKTIDFDSEEGKNLAELNDIDALPAYIFDSRVKDAHNYGKLSTVFRELDGIYIVKSTVANSNYYIGRQEVPAKLDLIAKPGQLASQQAEENLKEFLEAFKGKVKFEKHDASSILAKELGVNAFPFFLVNNKVKFNGVQPAQKIKENFCAMNDAGECNVKLRESLV